MKNINITTRMTNTKSCTHIDLECLLDKIRSGSDVIVKDKNNSAEIKPGMTVRDVQSIIDTTSDIAQKNKLKVCLPFACVNGIFSERNKDKLRQYGCYIIMDYDYKLPADQVLRDQDWIEFKKYPFVMAMYRSPKGGIKVIVKHSNTDSTLHSELYRQIAGKLRNSKIDMKCSGIAGGHFISYDPNLYYNPDATVFNFSPTDSVPPMPKAKGKGKSQSLLSPPVTQGIPLTPDEEDSVIQKIQAWSDSSFPVCPGHRNMNVFKFAEQLKREGVSMQSTLEYLVLRYVEKDFDYSEIECIVISVYRKAD